MNNFFYRGRKWCSRSAACNKKHGLPTFVPVIRGFHDLIFPPLALSKSGYGSKVFPSSQPVASSSPYVFLLQFHCITIPNSVNYFPNRRNRDDVFIQRFHISLSDYSACCIESSLPSAFAQLLSQVQFPVLLQIGARFFLSNLYLF